jgi:hypothetical protein
MLIGLDINTKKKPLENDNQTLEAKTNKFACKGTCITQLFITKLKLLYDPESKILIVYSLVQYSNYTVITKIKRQCYSKQIKNDKLIMCKNYNTS